MKRTYYPHYYSIEDILVTQERVPCVAEQELSEFHSQITKFLIKILISQRIWDFWIHRVRRMI